MVLAALIVWSVAWLAFGLVRHHFLIISIHALVILAGVVSIWYSFMATRGTISILRLEEAIQLKLADIEERREKLQALLATGDVTQVAYADALNKDLAARLDETGELIERLRRIEPNGGEATLKTARLDHGGDPKPTK